MLDAPIKYHLGHGVIGITLGMRSILGSILAIVVCGGSGGYVAWLLVAALGLGGTLGALVAAIVAMVIAVAAWAAGSSLLRAFGGIE